MVLKIQHFVAFVTLIGLFSCRESIPKLSKIEAEQLSIDHSLAKSDSIEAYIAPYRARINEVLDSTLAYAAITISKEEGTYNTPAGNLMADIAFSEAGPIFKSRTGNTIDLVLFNHGGIRSIISKGKVTSRTAFEVMPFENSIVVVELSGKAVLELVDYIVRAKRPHPVSGIQVILDKNGTLNNFYIQGKPFDIKKTYHVATTDYLISGGGDMHFFDDPIRVTHTDYLLRNAMIDYFKKVDTLAPVIDDRFYKLN